MKIGTFNLHQYYELNRLNTLVTIAEKIHELDLDIVGLQEVAEFVYDFSEEKATNTAKLLQHILKEKYNSNYYLSLNMFKYGFPDNLEGLAMLSKHEFTTENNVLVSNTTDSTNFHKREIQINTINYKNRELTIVNGHYCWDNELERFTNQIDKLLPHLENKQCILMGDFNNDYNTDNYKYLTKYFKDICDPKLKAEITFNYDDRQVRIDYILTNLDYELINHNIHFKDNMLSDHYFVSVQVDLK